ncbi:MAG TPA: hypothetical protein V6C88_17325 [Chroococcidiopsis sp.]
MIDVRYAVTSAYQYFESIKDILGGDQLADLRLEEVELSEDKHAWLITLGYDLLDKNRSQFEELMVPKKPFRREYKLFRVNSETGEVEAMKIRQV